jgi:hypothetical protein
VLAVPHLCGFNPGICLTTEEKARKTLSQGSTKSACWHDERIHRHNNKNT